MICRFTSIASRRTLALLALVLLVTFSQLGCGTHRADVIVDESSDVGASDSSSADTVLADADVGGLPIPSITIREPHDVEACVGDDATRPAEIEVNLTNWRAAAEGTCAGVTHCGPVYVTVGGDDCNQAGLPYDTVITSGPPNHALMLLVRCKSGVVGTKTVRVELHDDDGSVHAPLTFDARSVQFKICSK